MKHYLGLVSHTSAPETGDRVAKYRLISQAANRKAFSFSFVFNTDSDPVENEEGLIIKIRPDNSFEITVVQRS